VNPSGFFSRDICNDPRLIVAATRENRPGNSGELIRERNRQHISMQPLRSLLDPGPQTALCRNGPAYQDNMCGLYE
jgi:hypothetical protein